jgi:hypothetical protein
MVDDKPVKPVPRYIFNDVTENHRIEASFAGTGYTITTFSGPNGEISPSGPVRVDHGGSQSFEIKPSAGYRIAKVMVDDKPVKPVPRYTFNDVTENHRIEASFEPLPHVYVRTAFDPEIKALWSPNRPELNPRKQITLEAWFKTEARGTRQAIIYKPYTQESSGEPYYQYNLELRQTGQLYFALAVNGVRRNIDGAFLVDPNKWYHVAATYDGKNMRLYLFGKEWKDPFHAEGTLSNCPTPLYIGTGPKGSGNPDRPFRGQLAEVRIWNVARTGEQIRAGMNKILTVQDNVNLVWSSSDSPKSGN